MGQVVTIYDKRRYGKVQKSVPFVPFRISSIIQFLFISNLYSIPYKYCVPFRVPFCVPLVPFRVNPTLFLYYFPTTSMGLFPKYPRDRSQSLLGNVPNNLDGIVPKAFKRPFPKCFGNNKKLGQLQQTLGTVSQICWEQSYLFRDELNRLEQKSST